MDTPLISVILATYNGSRYLHEAILSVLEQDYSNLELIIIDDGSTDEGIRQIVESFSSGDARIRYERNHENMERSWSKNRGVALAKGEYIAFIDDDDVWEEEKLSKQMKLIEHDKTIGIIGTCATFINESGESIGETHHLKISKEDVHNNILLSNQFIQSSVLLRKEIFLQAGGFPSFNLCEDYDCWLRILQISNGVNVSQSLIQYRVRTASTTTRHLYQMKWITLKLVWKYKKSFPGVFKSLITRIVTFPFNATFLLRIWNYIFKKESRL